MIATSEIERMSVEERLQTIEILWRSISHSHDSLESPLWHREILASRRAKVDSGKGVFLSIADLRNRLKQAS